MVGLLKQLGVAMLYALLIYLDHSYFESGTIVSSFEAASGFALAVLLLGGKRYAWGVFLGGILAMAASPWGAAVVTSSGHALEAFCGAWLLRHDYKFEKSLHDYLRLILLGGVVGVGIGANFGVAASLVFGFAAHESFSYELIHWWTGDTLGIALITPLILVFWQTKNNWREMDRVAEASMLLGLTFLAGQIVFLGWFHDSLGNIARGHWMFLFITWVAVRLGIRGTVIAMTMIAIQSTFSTFHGVGFFADDITQSHLSNYWLYTLTLSVVGMALATFIAERNRLMMELQRFFDLVPDMVCIASTDGYFKKINRAWQATLGHTEMEILATPFLEFIHPDDRDATVKEVERQLAGEKNSRFCNRYRCKDGSYKLLEWKTLLPVDGTMLYGSARDITERQQIEAEKEIALHKAGQAQALLQTVLDSTPDWIFAKDANYRFLFVNRAFAASQGCMPQDIIGRPDTDFWPDEMCLGDPARGIRGFHADDDDAMAGKLVHNPNDQATYNNGELHAFDTLKLPLLDTGGHCYGVLGYARDVTEGNRVKKELRESKNQLQATLDAIPDLLFDVGLDGRIHDYHSPRTDLLAAPPEIFLGKTFSDVLPSGVAQACMSALREAHENGLSTGKQYELPLPQGKRWFELSVSSKPANPDQEPRFIFLARDITERKAAEQQLHDLGTYMLNIREEEKARLAREIHDELGGMLTALKMDTCWLSRKLPANGGMAPFIERINSMSQRVDNAVSVTRRIITDLRPSILDDLGLLPALEWQAAEFHKNTGIECRVNCIEEEAVLDKQHSIALFRILQEALTNVSRHAGASRVEIEFHHSEKEVILTISDNGRSMTGNNIAATKSYGILGMTERVEQLGGEIAFGSQSGGGFSVTVVLPLPAGE